MRSTSARRLAMALAAAAASLLAACGPADSGRCTGNADCAESPGKVCVDGACEECGLDGDCQAGFVCRTLRCVPKPECMSDPDCPDGKVCEGERCVAARVP